MFVLFVLVLPGTCAAVPVIICGGFYTDCLKGYNSGWFQENLNFQIKYQLSDPVEHVLKFIPDLADRWSMCLSKKI